MKSGNENIKIEVPIVVEEFILASLSLKERDFKAIKVLIEIFK